MQALDAHPTVDNLTKFLKEDKVAVEALDAVATAAGVVPASNDLLIVEEEDVARLSHLGVDSLSKLREAFQSVEPVVARLMVQWRKESDSAITHQEFLWALTYVLAAQRDEPSDRIRALVGGERWWQRATESHRNRFLDRIVSEIVVAEDPERDV